MHRIFKSANFRLVLMYAVIFSLSVFILGLVIFYSIRASVENQIRTQVALDASQLMGDYRDDGIEELRHDINEIIEANPANRLLYSIRSNDGRIIFDKISAELPHAGWHKISTPEGKHYLLYSVDLQDGYRFSVAADMGRAIDLQTTIRNVFAVAFILSLLLGVAGGLVVSRRFLARVDSFNRIAEDIGRGGALERRLPLDGSGDDFDQLAEIVNTMLERIENLVLEIRQVTTNIAHDLRTPLGHIRQKLESLGDDCAQDPEASRKLGEIVALLDDTLQTFSALLHLAEIESGTYKNRFADVDLSKVLSDLTMAYKSVAEEQGLSLTFAAQPGVFEVMGEKKLLTQLFVNLIENAIRHSGKPAVIQVGVESSGEEVLVSIADTGRGVPPEEWGNIAKPFYRLEPSRNTPGSGLGLSFVSAIAKLHDARIDFEDNQPGLKVALRFPAAAAVLSGVQKE